jgi:polygalacturonase
MQLKRIILSISVLSLAHSIYANDVEVTKYGAKGDSTTLNSIAIQKAIDDCNRTGGGNVFFPAGIYLSGTIVL